MDKYTIAPPAGSSNNSVGAADRPWREGHFDSVKLNGGDLGEYLAESTGYGIVSGCEPSISGLTVTVGAGIVHLADGTRKELSATNITLDAADPTNPRIDLVYITSAGEVAKITGTAAASPSTPDVPSGGISICNVTVAPAATVGVVTYKMNRLIKRPNLIKTISQFSKVGTVVSDLLLTSYDEAMTFNTRTQKIIVSAWKYEQPRANILFVLNKDTYAIENTYTIAIEKAINSLSYNEQDNVLYASATDPIKFYKINADNMTSFSEMSVPSGTTYIAHDNINNLDVAITYGSLGTNNTFRIYNNGFTDIINTFEINGLERSLHQDFCFHNGKIYGASFKQFAEIDAFSGEITTLGAYSWNEIEGITFVDDDLLICSHQGNEVFYIYKYLTHGTPQKYDELVQQSVQSTEPNINLNYVLADGVYRVTTNESAANNYPFGETEGILCITNASRFDEHENYFRTIQKFQSTSYPWTEYIRVRKPRSWSEWSTYIIKTDGQPIKIKGYSTERTIEVGLEKYTRGQETSGIFYQNGLNIVDKDGTNLAYIQGAYSTNSATLYIGLMDVMEGTTGWNHDGLIYIEQRRGTPFKLKTNCSISTRDDNTKSLGEANYRWTEVFAATATINTSDERLKENISSIPDEVLDAWGDVNWCQYQFKDAVTKKGEDARLHNGLIAQRIKNVFETHGLDAARYGLYCYDEWEAEAEECDSAGNIVRNAIPAGNRYSLRYEECLAIEAAYQRRRADRLEERIKAIEDKLNLL